MNQSLRQPSRRWWLAAGLALSLVATTHPFGYPDSDAWWHLAVGRLILNQGIPSVEPFAFLHAGHAWVGQQWLYEVLLAKTVFGGSGGLAVVVLALAGAAAFAFAASSTPPTVPGKWMAAAMVLGAFVAAQILGVRGQVFTALGTGVVIWILGKWRRGDEKIIWALPPLMLLWANLHAGFITGLGLVLLHCLLPRGQSWGIAGNRRHLLWASVAAFAATLINPAGLGLYPYVLETFTNPVLTQAINEWSSPDFHQLFIRLFEIIAVTLVVCWIVAGEVEWCDVVTGLGTIAASLEAQRNVALFAVVATPQLARYGYASWKETASRLTQGPARRSLVLRVTQRAGDTGKAFGASLQLHARTTATALLACLMIVVGANVVAPQVRASDDGSYTASHYPVAAATYYSTHFPGQRLFSSYAVGGYLAYRFPQGRVVYIYGESAVFGTKDLEQYQDIVNIGSDWRKQLASLLATHAIVPAESPEASAFMEVGWRPDCYDPSGYVLLSVHPITTGLAHSPQSNPQNAPVC